MDIKALIQSSFTEAKSKPITRDTTQKIHQKRSRIWVETLAGKFRELYRDDSYIRVFSKYHAENRKDFGLNELLYDVTVCRVGETESIRHRKLLYYIEDVLWQVESEFAENSRAALIDFNKLVLGSAKNKLFVGPFVSKAEHYLKFLEPAAKSCTGNVYTALIPHPGDWDMHARSIQICKFDGQHWIVL